MDYCAPARYLPTVVVDGPRRGVHATSRIPWEYEQLHVVAVCGLTSFEPKVASRIAQLLNEGEMPPRMRLEPIPKPTCICGWAPGEHAPNCHRAAA